MNKSIDLIEAFSGVRVTRSNGSVLAAFPRKDTQAYAVYGVLKPEVPSVYTERHHPGPNIMLAFSFEELQAAASRNPELAPVLQLVEKTVESAAVSALG
jgi:hypothetical protein